MKWQILIIILILIPAVLGDYPLCKHSQEISQNCTMLTPSITCSNYSYKIFNASNGGVIEDAILANVTTTIFKFNFTLGEGRYIVELCDHSTREVMVTYGEDKGMLLGAIVLLPMLLGFLLIIIAHQVNDNNGWLKLVLVLISMLSFFLSLYFAAEAVYTLYGSWGGMAQAISLGVWIGGAVVLIIYGVILVSVMYHGFMAMIEKRNKDRGLD